MFSKLLCAKIVALVAALALILLPSVEGNASVWSAAGPAMPVFLHQQSGGPVVAPPPTSGGVVRGILPSSALAGGGQCSAQPGGGSTECSTGSASGQRICSILCDGNGRCSVQATGPSPQGDVRCSTLGATDEACSVLLPAAGGPGGDAFCSALTDPILLGGSNMRCSAHGIGHFSVCSAQMPRQTPEFANRCSAANQSIALGGAATVRCSVFQSAPKSACSTIQRGAGKQCSVFTTEASCSVIEGANGPLGKCTSLRGAAFGSCSVFGGAGSGNNARCSIIGGADGSVCGVH